MTYWSLTVGGGPLLPYTSRLFYYISIYIYIFFFFFLFTIALSGVKYRIAKVPLCRSDTSVTQIYFYILCLV